MADNYSDIQRCRIQANLYIINRIYTHTKGHINIKNETFFELIHISKPRYYRILSGDNFHIKKDDCAKIGEKFGISERYFTGEKLIDFEGLKEEHWIAFFKDRNKMPKEHKDRNNLTVINNKLSNIRYNNILGEYPVNSEIYRIQFYFMYSKRLEEEEASLKINRAVSELEVIGLVN